MLRELPLHTKYMLPLSKFIIKTCSSANARDSTFHSTILLITFVSLLHHTENRSSKISGLQTPSFIIVQILCRTEVRQQVCFVGYCFNSNSQIIQALDSLRKIKLKKDCIIWVVIRNTEFEWKKNTVMTIYQKKGEDFDKGHSKRSS